MGGGGERERGNKEEEEKKGRPLVSHNEGEGKEGGLDLRPKVPLPSLLFLVFSLCNVATMPRCRVCQGGNPNDKSPLRIASGLHSPLEVAETKPSSA